MLSLFLFSLAMADTPSWAPAGAHVSPYRGVTGLDIQVVSPEGHSYAVLILGDKALPGPAGFRAAVARLPGASAEDLARLSMQFLDLGMAGRDPWTTGQTYAAQDQAQLAAPATLEGGRLVYWRPNEQMAGVSRVTVDVAAARILSEESGLKLVEDASAPTDPVVRAIGELANLRDYGWGRRGVERLASSGDYRAVVLIIDAAFNHRYPEVRAAAVDAFARVHPPGEVSILCQIMLGDESADVRLQAVKGLGRLNDPTSRDCLEKAMDETEEPVRGLAYDALRHLPR